MTVIQGLIASIAGRSGPTPSISFNSLSPSGSVNEGDIQYGYIDVVNYPPTLLYWKVWAYDVDGNDFGGGSLPSGTLTVEGTGQYSFGFTVNADELTEGVESYGVTVAYDPDYNNQLMNIYPITINDTSRTAADFTIEWFQKSTSYGGNPRPWAVGLYPFQTLAISYEGNSADYFWINNSYVMTTTQNHVNQGWQHIAYVRKDGVIKGYLNGTQYTSSVNNNTQITTTNQSLFVGTGELAAGMFIGHITNLHIIKGTAKYTGNFTPPTEPINSVGNTKFLLKATDDSTKYVDATGKTAAPVGNPTPPAWSSDTPFTVVGPYSQYSNQAAQGGGIGYIRFAGAYYNTDILNVKAGWTVTNGTYSGTVLANAQDTGSFIEVQVDFIAPAGTTWTFTQPPLGGSLYFDGTNYIDYGASSDWAMDV